MKSVGMLLKPSGSCLALTRWPRRRDCSRPPLPYSSICVIRLPENTAISPGATCSTMRAQSMPTERSASVTPTTVICRPRGWKRELYSSPGSKPVGSWPADFTGSSR